MRTLALVAALVASAGAARAVDAPDERRSFFGPDANTHVKRHHAYRLDDVRVAVTPDYATRTIAGDVVNTLTTVDDHVSYVDLDAANLSFAFVGLRDGTRLPYRTFGETLRVLLPRGVPAGTRLAIRTTYHAHPSAGFYFVEPDAGYPDRPFEVWTQGESQDNHYWFPTYDDLDLKATSETLTTLPEGQEVMSNGRLVAVTHDSRRRTVTYDWREAVPHSTYLISLVGGEFHATTEKLGDLDVEYFAPRGQEHMLAYDFRNTPKMITFFAHEIGVPYPYEKFAQSAVVDFTYGGMENISAVTQSSRTLHEPSHEIDYTSDPLVAHELAHQWWGDLVTCADWGEFWLNEGFATFYDARYTEHAKGRDAYDMRRLDGWRKILATDRRYRRPIVTHTYAHAFDLADSTTYEKGAAVLHMLRTVLGDDAFRAAQHAYLAAYRERNADTRQWEGAIETSAHTQLRWFVDEWLYAAGWPEYELRYTYDAAAHLVRLHVAQKQSTAWRTPDVFIMPVEVLVMTADGAAATTRVRSDLREQDFEIPSAAEPAMVLFDPGQNILSKQTFRKPPAEWAFQAMHAAAVLDRFTAVKALADDPTVDDEQLRVAIIAAKRESDEDARAEETSALIAAGRRPLVRAALLAAMSDASAHVRAKAAAALGAVPSDADSIAVLTEAVERDPSSATKAEAIAALAALRAPDIRRVLRKAVLIRSHRELVRVAALKAYVSTLGRGAIPVEERYGRYGEPPDARVAAIEALGDIGAGDHEVTAFLASGLSDSNFYIVRATTDALGKLRDPAAVPALARLARTNENYRLREAAQSSIERIVKGAHHG